MDFVIGNVVGGVIDGWWGIFQFLFLMFAYPFSVVFTFFVVVIVIQCCFQLIVEMFKLLKVLARGYPPAVVKAPTSSKYDRRTTSATIKEDDMADGASTPPNMDSGGYKPLDGSSGKDTPPKSG